MGSDGSKARKAKHPLHKVPKFEEPNDLPLPGLGGDAGLGFGRFGHSADHHHFKQPGRLGRLFLRVLGGGPRGRGPR